MSSESNAFEQAIYERHVYRQCVPLCVVCGRNDAHGLANLNSRAEPVCALCWARYQTEAELAKALRHVQE